MSMFTTTSEREIAAHVALKHPHPQIPLPGIPGPIPLQGMHQRLRIRARRSICAGAHRPRSDAAQGKVFRDRQAFSATSPNSTVPPSSETPIAAGLRGTGRLAQYEGLCHGKQFIIMAFRSPPRGFYVGPSLVAYASGHQPAPSGSAAARAEQAPGRSRLPAATPQPPRFAASPRSGAGLRRANARRRRVASAGVVAAGQEHLAADARKQQPLEGAA